jgi:hypothetical protein
LCAVRRTRNLCGKPRTRASSGRHLPMAGAPLHDSNRPPVQPSPWASSPSCVTWS